MKKLWRISTHCGLAAVLTAAGGPARAADVVWDGNGGTGGVFLTAVNWAGNVLPGGSDVARIDSNTSTANPVTLSSGVAQIDNLNLGPTTSSFMEVNGGTLIAFGSNVKDFSIGLGASQQSVFKLSSGTVEFGSAGVYTDGNDFDIGKNGNGRYVQTGGVLRQHADDVKIADSSAGVGLLEISGGQMHVSDGFSVSDSAGGTGTMLISGNAEVVSGNSGGLASGSGTTATGYISVANRGGTGVLTISGNGALYGRYLEYVGEPGATANITIGGTGGKLVISEEKVLGAAGSGSNANAIGIETGAPGNIAVQESGLFAVDNNTFNDFSDGYVIGRSGSGTLSAAGTNARVVVRQRLLLAGGGSDMDFASGSPGFATPGSGEMLVGPGGNVAVSELHIGVTGSGTLSQNGGAIAAVNGSALFAEAGMENGMYGEDVYLGTQTGSTGVYNHSGGTLTAGDDFIIGHFGNGVYNMTGSAVVAGAGWTVLGNEAGSSGTWNISGGTFNQSFGDLEIGDAGTGTVNLAGGTLNVSGYTAVGHRSGSGLLHVSGTGVLNTPDLKILMGKDGNMTTSGVLRVGGQGGQINVANALTMDESQMGHENKIIADLVASGITTIKVGGSSSIERGALVVQSDPGFYKPTAGDQYVLIDTGSWSGQNRFASVTTNVTLARTDDILFQGTGFSGAGGSATKYEVRVTARGDFDVNLDVNAADLNVWAANFGSTSGSYAKGDANQDGRVNGIDLLSWQRNFGSYAAASAVAASVPEPAACTLVLAGLAAGLRRRIRR